MEEIGFLESVEKVEQKALDWRSIGQLPGEYGASDQGFGGIGVEGLDPVAAFLSLIHEEVQHGVGAENLGREKRTARI